MHLVIPRSPISILFPYTTLFRSLPDYFMEQVEARGEWYLFDPHEVRQVMGYSIEDFYDEEKGKGSWRKKYLECVAHEGLSKKKEIGRASCRERVESTGVEGEERRDKREQDQ